MPSRSLFPLHKLTQPFRPTFLCLFQIFIVVGIALPKWVQGTLSGVTTEIGLFEQCVDDDCFSSSINIDTWKAAAAFFILA